MCLDDEFAILRRFSYLHLRNILYLGDQLAETQTQLRTLDAAETVQVLGVCVKGRLTKDVFDRTMALHPSAAEELVTLYDPSYRLRGGQRVDA